jgi:uncharacterized protein (UPF0210 family)
MDLRAITISVPVSQVGDVSRLHEKLQPLFGVAKQLYAERSISIRTFRINLTPIAVERDGKVNAQRIYGEVECFSKLSEALGVRWFNVPFDLSSTDAATSQTLCEIAFDVLKRFPRTFINLIVAQNNTINFHGIGAASTLIKNVSRLDNSGYNNFRVAVSAGGRPDSPFFPSTFSSNSLGFSIALEMTRTFISVVNSSKSTALAARRKSLVEAVAPQLREIESVASAVSQDQGIEFKGMDISLAPYPEENNSVAQLVEFLSVEQQGGNGTLFVTAFLTDILRSLIELTKIKTVGFNGVMYSLLEDEFMGKRNRVLYSIDSLISYSAVCGCGLDMVPLPGDVFEEEISSMICDIAALSMALKKPLMVRLLPIPMKHANEFTCFNMDFLVNTRIMNIKNVALANSMLKREGFLKFQTESRSADSN